MNFKDDLVSLASSNLTSDLGVIKYTKNRWYWCLFKSYHLLVSYTEGGWKVYIKGEMGTYDPQIWDISWCYTVCSRPQAEKYWKIKTICYWDGKERLIIDKIQETSCWN